MQGCGPRGIDGKGGLSHQRGHPRRLLVSFAFAVPVVVAVATGELESVLAALTVLAPQATLIEGAGL